MIYLLINFFLIFERSEKVILYVTDLIIFYIWKLGDTLHMNFNYILREITLRKIKNSRVKENTWREFAWNFND